ncbi:MAG: primosomal protein N' [Clostridia bacterium]|nr:primosomal protein N' [Clostridia bacterium]
MIARVIVDISNSETDKIFDYEILSNLDVRKGSRVIVPFGTQRLEGFCIDITPTSEVPTLKSVEGVLDEFVCVSEEMLSLMRYMKERFYVRYVDSLRLFIPSKLRGGRVKELTRLYLTLNPSFTYEEIVDAIPERAKSQLSLVERLKDGGEYLSVIAGEFSASAINALVSKDLLIKTSEQVERKPMKSVKGGDDKYVLRDGQKKALDSIFSSEQTAVLLHGVTGSGKTLVYMNAIKRVLDEGKTAIMLVPEISLTPQMLRNFRGYFGDSVAMLHSGLSDGERFDEWKRLLKGEAKIVVGARSAIFAPVKNLGLVIVDEEHDASYISESNPRYRTVDVALFRANYNKAKVVLGSATPSIESYLCAKRGEYALAEMNERISDKGMPNIEIVNMSNELLMGNVGMFSAKLEESIKQTVAKGEQVMIFLNRRGHSSFVMCRKCGYIAKCTDCDVSLTYHSVDNMLKCHYCGKRFKMLSCCPDCGSVNIKYGKLGTQRVVEEVEKLVPGVKVLRMDNETTTTKTAYLDILGAFAAKEAQVLVGTQMIAKGHDFPDVTLVGILDADMSLYHQDYRSNERTFQLVTQVAGRAGRSNKGGKVILQTYSPNHYVYRFASRYDYEGFFEKENNVRMTTNFPPYTTIIRVLMTSENEDKVIDCAKTLYRQLRQYAENNSSEFLYIQAMRAPLGRIQNKYRYQIIARIKRQKEREIIAEFYGAIEKNKFRQVSVFAELNPQNMA